MKKWIALAGILSVGLVTPAYAADSATDTYSGQGSPLGNAAQGGSPSATPTPGATPSVGEVAGASTEPGKNGAGVPAGRAEENNRPGNSVNPGNSGNPDGGADNSPQRIEQPGRTLPFTGFDVALIALGGLGLIGLGLGVRRLSRPGPRTAS